MDHDAFLQAIVAEPDDDGLRLMYADWLEENGDPRGEFIRLQCALAGMRYGDPRRHGMDSRARELLARYGNGWLRPLSRWVRRGAFRRGFVERITVNAQVYLDHEADILRAAPIQHVLLDLTGVSVPERVLALVPESLARENVALPLALAGTTLRFVMADPCDYDAIGKIQFILNRKIATLGATREQVVEAINRYYGPTITEFADTFFFIFPEPGIASDTDDVGDEAGPVGRLVQLYFQEAINLRATEILIEPQADRLCVRCRIDG
jgi:uncharacterized protein (TIGR02996 family)